jgi:indolepyruvate ferredoxin oxidoreductase
VLIYDQTCAAEKRRRRKRGQIPDPGKRVVINELVCEGCGDCGVQSNCVAIQPVETEFGRKRAIDQSVCNMDFSCQKGFCPSFVTVHGAVARKGVPLAEDEADLPDPPRAPVLRDTYAILVTGVGGTGVVTIGALIAMAAHLEGKAAAVIDMAGLARKGGPVTSHVRIAPAQEDIKAVRIAAGGADLLIGCDAVVAGSARLLAAIDPGRTAVFVNTHETYPGAFTHDPDYRLPMRRIVQAITARAGASKSRFIEATEIATALLGDAIASNMFMLGLAWQAGQVPLSHFAILRAIELNGVDVAMNRAAFGWGRRAAVEADAVAEIAAGRSGRRKAPVAESVEELAARRMRFLTEYQDEHYAQLYADAVAAMREAEARVAPGRADLTEAVARNLFRLMAIKDEYEVARLFTDGSFERQLAGTFDGWGRIEFHMAPPLFGRRDRETGYLKKKAYGPGLVRVLRWLARLRRLRGSWLDPFGHTNERRMERRLLADYQATLAQIRERLSPENHHLAVALARFPEKIRGYGHVKAAAILSALPEAAARREAFLAGRAQVEAAE